MALVTVVEPDPPAGPRELRALEHVERPVDRRANRELDVREALAQGAKQEGSR